jgi:microcystin-dependent protein
MSAPFLAEIRMWACSFAPTGWAFCDGQLMQITQNTALFSLLGTNFGGDGKTTFGLPSLQGAAPMHWGQARSQTVYTIGQLGGEPTVTLLESKVPSHTHALQATPRNADLDKPSPQNSLARSNPGYIYKQPAGAATPQALAQGAVVAAGGSQPHNNMMPYQTLNFCIAMQGIYPART